MCNHNGMIYIETADAEIITREAEEPMKADEFALVERLRAK